MDAAGYYNGAGKFVCLRWYCPRDRNVCSVDDIRMANDFIPAATDASRPPKGCVCDDSRFKVDYDVPDFWARFNDAAQAAQGILQSGSGTRLVRPR